MAFNRDTSGNPLFAAASLIEAALTTASQIQQAQQCEQQGSYGGLPSPWVAPDRSGCHFDDRQGYRHERWQQRGNRGGDRDRRRKEWSAHSKKGGFNPKRSETSNVSGDTRSFSKQRSESTKVEEGSYADVDPCLLKCTECNVKVRSGENFERHLKGVQHQRLMETLKQQHAKMNEVMRLKVQMDEMVLKNQTLKAKNANKPPTVHCNMCQLDVCGPLAKHRLSKSHQDLKSFLHPHCNVCAKPFQQRCDWDAHKYSASHLINMSKASGFRVDDDYASKAVQPVVKAELAEEPKVDVVEKKTDDEAEKLKKTEDLELSAERVQDYVVPAEEEGKILGVSMVKPVNGFFCCICKKFFASKLSEHCRSSDHYSKFVECVEEKKRRLKRKLEDGLPVESEDNDNVGGKVQKLENDVA